MKVTVLYFAKLKSLKGVASETIDTDCRTVGELFDALALKENSGMSKGHLKPAVNEAFCDYTAPLTDGDTVAFLPPMSGG